jgi:dTDP-4-amino-4,6-dideoxygalactose transaminase
MTEVQAAIGRVQLEKFGGILKSRQDLAAQYTSALSGFPPIALPQWFESHTWQTFMVILDAAVDRAKIIEALAGQGIEAGPGSVAAHLARFAEPSRLAVSERLHWHGLALPLFSGLDPAEVPRICACIKALFRTGA